MENFTDLVRDVRDVKYPEIVSYHDEVVTKGQVLVDSIAKSNALLNSAINSAQVAKTSGDYAAQAQVSISNMFADIQSIRDNYAIVPHSEYGKFLLDSNSRVYFQCSFTPYGEPLEFYVKDSSGGETEIESGMDVDQALKRYYVYDASLVGQDGYIRYLAPASKGTALTTYIKNTMESIGMVEYVSDLNKRLSAALSSGQSQFDAMLSKEKTILDAYAVSISNNIQVKVDAAASAVDAYTNLDISKLNKMIAQANDILDKKVTDTKAAMDALTKSITDAQLYVNTQVATMQASINATINQVQISANQIISALDTQIITIQASANQQVNDAIAKLDAMTSLDLNTLNAAIANSTNVIDNKITMAESSIDIAVNSAIAKLQVEVNKDLQVVQNAVSNASTVIDTVGSLDLTTINSINNAISNIGNPANLSMV